MGALHPLPRENVNSESRRNKLGWRGYLDNEGSSDVINALEGVVRHRRGFDSFRNSLAAGLTHLVDSLFLFLGATLTRSRRSFTAGVTRGVPQSTPSRTSGHCSLQLHTVEWFILP